MFGTENGECRMRPITYYHNNQLWVGEPSHIFDSGTHFEEWKGLQLCRFHILHTFAQLKDSHTDFIYYTLYAIERPTFREIAKYIEKAYEGLGIVKKTIDTKNENESNPTYTTVVPLCTGSSHIDYYLIFYF